MEIDKITQNLSPGEQILWASSPAPGIFLDRENKNYIIRWFAVTGALFILAAVLYIRYCIRTESGIFSVLFAVFVITMTVIFLDPVTTFHCLKKTKYAITNYRLIVSQSASIFSLPLSKAGVLKIIDNGDGFATIITGSNASPRPSSLRMLGLRGNFINEDGETVRYPVFYHVADARNVVRILNHAAEDAG